MNDKTWFQKPEMLFFYLNDSQMSAIEEKASHFIHVLPFVICVKVLNYTLLYLGLKVMALHFCEYRWRKHSPMTNPEVFLKF